MRDNKCVIIGAGPAGLTAGYQLAMSGTPAVVFEKDPVVGGISRTVNYNGYRCDIGGHRFFTKNRNVQDLWNEILPNDFLERPRLSRIYYNGRFFDYPLRLLNTFRNLGLAESVRVLASYLATRASPSKEETTFEQWVSNRFGRRLFDIFFKTYTEKIWGIPCSEISADWARQRIKNLDLKAAVKNALIGSATHRNRVVTSLIGQFHYPRLGPGQMWERCRDILAEHGVETRCNTEIVALRHDSGRVVSATVRDESGRERLETGSFFVSSMPLQRLVEMLSPAPPPEVLAAARRLRYRDFLTVVLVVDKRDVFPDNWIYVHAPEVKVGRIQNFKNWSPGMAPDPSRTSLGLEYFLQEHDELWRMDERALVALGAQECAALGLIREESVIDGTVIRMPKAYPVYDADYKDALSVIRAWLSGLSNFLTIGRNGQHRYNNQDHSMLTGMLAARAVRGEKADVWEENEDESYHEEVLLGESEPLSAAIIGNVFARYDPVALGAACGATAGAALLAASAVLLLKGGPVVGPTLSLAGQYLIGYRVTWAGTALGVLQAGLGGYLFGYVLARLINMVIGWHETIFRREVEAIRTLV